MTRWLVVVAACGASAAPVSNHAAAPASEPTPKAPTFQSLALTLAPACGEAPKLEELTAWGFLVSACGQHQYVRCSTNAETAQMCCTRMPDEARTTEYMSDDSTEPGICRQIPEGPRP